MSRVYAWLGHLLPHLRLEPGIRSSDGSRLEITFFAEHSFAKPAFLEIFVPDLCIQFDPTVMVSVVFPPMQTNFGFEARASVSAGILQIILLPNKPSAQGQLFRLVVFNVACPHISRSSVHDVKAIFYDYDRAVVALSNSGVFESVVDNMGTRMPWITLSSQMPGASNVIATIQVIPASAISSPSLLLITLPGIGFSLSKNTVIFDPPSIEVSAQASFTSDADAVHSVLSIRFLSGVIAVGRLLDIRLPGTFNNAQSQLKASDSVSAAWYSSNNSLVSASVFGRFPEIFPFYPCTKAVYGHALKFAASAEVHGFEWNQDVTLAVSASMSNISFSQQAFSEHVLISVVPWFIGSDELNVYHLKPGGLEMSAYACPAVLDRFDENVCMSLNHQISTLEFRHLLNFSAVSVLPALFVRWQGYLRCLRHEVLTFETQSTGRIRLWLDGKLYADSQPLHSSNVTAAFTVEITSMNSLMLISVDYFGLASEAAATVFWSSKILPRQVRSLRVLHSVISF
jgi:hypothetical protein